MLIFVTCDVSPFAGFAWFLARAVLNLIYIEKLENPEYAEMRHGDVILI